MAENRIRGLRLYEIEEYIVTEVARRMFEGNESQAIRFMIREFPKHNPILDDGAPLGILQPAVPEGGKR